MDSQAEVDVVVIGVGTCGEDLSLQLMDAGLDVVGVEAALVGGECRYWACIPSKRTIRMGNLVASRVEWMGLQDVVRSTRIGAWWRPKSGMRSQAAGMIRTPSRGSDSAEATRTAGIGRCAGRGSRRL